MLATRLVSRENSEFIYVHSNGSSPCLTLNWSATENAGHFYVDADKQRSYRFLEVLGVSMDNQLKQVLIHV